jgi:hypothetical protein
MRACSRCGFASAVIAAPNLTHRAPVARGWSPPPRQEPGKMSPNDAHEFAFSLARSLMAVIVIFRAGDGTLSVTPATEFDGDAEVVVEIDPFGS